VPDGGTYESDSESGMIAEWERNGSGMGVGAEQERNGSGSGMRAEADNVSDLNCNWVILFFFCSNYYMIYVYSNEKI